MESKFSLLCMIFYSSLLCSQINFDFDEYFIIESNAQVKTVVAHGDIDNDGDIDVISGFHPTNIGYKIVLFENIENHIEYNSYSIIGEVSAYINSIDVIDLDSDGDLDIFISNSDGIFWYENIDNGNQFEPKPSITSPTPYVNRIATLSDLDNDGDLDIIASAPKLSGSLPKLVIHEHLDGLGTFGEEEIITSFPLTDNNQEIASIVSHDVNGDSFNDIIYSYKERIYIKISSGENLYFFPEYFLLPEIWGEIPSLDLIDIDDDQDIDIVAAIEDNRKIIIFKNSDALGSFNEQTILDITWISDKPSIVKVDDIDNDNDPDIIAASRSGHIWFFKNEEFGGTFSSGQYIYTNNDMNVGNDGLTLADIDSDNRLDIIVADGQFTPSGSNIRLFKII